MNKKDPQQQSNFLLYTSPDGEVKIEVFFQDETAWLTQKKMAELFGVETNTINYHLKEIFKSKELRENRTIRKIRIVEKEGSREVERERNFYNLDAIISVGYRVNSHQATQFRIWATKILREYIIKGFALDDERLKNGHYFDKKYFDELLERIREIRASERNFYQKITDIYALSIDYDPKSEVTKEFFATVQNKLHFAITGKTAAELIAEKANHKKPNMGLQTWKQAPKGKILRSDVSIGKNYLSEDQIDELNRVVMIYLEYAELQAKRKKVMTMSDWKKRLDTFLQYNEYEILNNPGKISTEVAKKIAEKEFDKFRIIQDQVFESDFDEAIIKYLKEK
jgi:hypothetical protein